MNELLTIGSALVTGAIAALVAWYLRGSQHSARIDEMAERLGKALLKASENAALVDRGRRQLKVAEDIAKSRATEVEGLIRERDQLQVTVNEGAELIERYKAEVQKATAREERRNATISDREKIIAELRAEIAKYAERVDTDEIKLNELRRTVDELTRKLQTRGEPEQEVTPRPATTNPVPKVPGRTPPAKKATGRHPRQ